MKLVHRTNYWGQNPIESTCAHDEYDVEEACVWAMARPDYVRPCCHRRGNRNVEFDSWSLTEVGGGHDGCEWVLYLIRENHGDVANHLFYKFCLCPRGFEPANRKDGRWEVVLGKDGKGAFSIDDYDGLDLLEERIMNRTGMLSNGRDHDGYVIHCHVGIICDQLHQGSYQ